jgi:hypothetical protein
MSRTLFLVAICSLALPTMISATPMDDARKDPELACVRVGERFSFEVSDRDMDYAELISICNNVKNPYICKATTQNIEDNGKKSPLQCKGLKP